MKQLLLTCIFALGALVASAQSETFKPFKVDVAFGYGIPGGGDAKGGVLFAIEPKYAISDALAFGLRFEGAVLARASMDVDGYVESVDAKLSGSYLATADYYFTTTTVRPFFGLGAGLFQLVQAQSTTINMGDEYVDLDESSTATKFGFTPRAGIEAGHFRAAVEYNVVGKNEGVNGNYLGIKLGFFLGGGRK
ncbi:hypothetical protein GS399_14805 [Pedobacter sp. HMF7647]|uniref:Outer membrane beta-barrel protein n=1 Tax=Hufsiella arboris TaxID=2695275 RepID=A0A7K1YCD6_9SPHI|nr:hypothetical protein [Hufsiella arboris]MXV52246.1 hypothetical protein [Hufsiella arboris]